MKITIDLRSLSSGNVSGVENYTLNLLEHLLTIDKKNTYTLYYNSWKKASLPDLHFINSKIVKTSFPNKVLNLMLMAKLVDMEKLSGPTDCLFMPNLNQFNINPNVKLVLTVHDLSPIVTPEYYDAKRNLWHKLLRYKQAFNRADLIFAVSDFTKYDLMKHFNLPENKIHVVHSGIDHKHFNTEIPDEKLREVRNIYGLPGDYILFLNTIEPRKNLSGVIKAFELLDHPVNLVIAGKKGWKNGGLFNQIRKSRKAKKIKYLGYIKEEDKPAIIKLSRGLVYPSFYEGFGFQPLEAMACGVPTVVSQVSALPEVVKDSSLLINPYDPNSMALALEQILSDEELSGQLVQKGLNLVKEYNWDKFAGQILEGLNSLY